MKNVCPWKVDAGASLPPFFYKNSIAHGILNLLLCICVILIIFIIISSNDGLSWYASEIILPASITLVGAYIIYYFTVFKQRNSRDKEILVSLTQLYYVINIVMNYICLNRDAEIDYYILSKYYDMILSIIKDIKPIINNYYNLLRVINYMQSSMEIVGEMINMKNDDVIRVLNNNLCFSIYTLSKFKDWEEIKNTMVFNIADNPIYSQLLFHGSFFKS